MYGTTPTTGPVARNDAAPAQMSVRAEQPQYGGYGYSEPAAFGYGPNYGGYGYAYETQPGNSGRCYQRRVRLNSHHWEWRRFCD